MGKRTTQSHNKSNIKPQPESEHNELCVTSKIQSENTLAHKRNGTLQNKDPTLNSHTTNGEERGQRRCEDSSLSMAADDDNKEDRDEDETEESGDSSHSGLPVDRGWAWVVMIAQFVITCMIVGYGRALSIFFLEFLAIFEVPVTTVTIVLGLMTAAFGFGNVLVSHTLLTRFSTRKVMLTGALINAGAIGLTALAPNMLYVTVMHCFIGFSHALLFVPGVTLVGHYFNKRRSFAMAVANTGLSVSALVFPPFTQFLVTFYGLRGALLLVAGIELQCVVAVCLLRPVSWYTKRKRPVNSARRMRHSEIQEEEKVKTQMPSSSCNRSTEDGHEGERDSAMTRLLEKSENTDHEAEILVQQSTASSAPFPTSPLSASLPEKKFLSNQSDDYHSSGEMPRILHHDRIKTFRTAYNRQQSCPPEYLHTLPKYGEKQPADSLSNVSALASSMVNICGSTMTIVTDAVLLTSPHDQEETISSVDRPARSRSCRGRCMSVISEIIDFSLFKNWLFRLIVVYVPLGFSAGFIAFYFPSLGVTQGLSRPRAALLMTVAGGVDLVSRLSVGYLADLQLVKRTHLVVVCMTLMGLACQFCKWYSNFESLTAFAVIYGLVGGVCNNLFAVVIIDLMGLELLGKVMGLVLLVNSAFASLNHVLIGALVDTTGSFIIPYNYVGASLFLSSLILLMEPLARRLEAKRVQKLGMDVERAREPVEA